MIDDDEDCSNFESYERGSLADIYIHLYSKS